MSMSTEEDLSKARASFAQKLIAAASKMSKVVKDSNVDMGWAGKFKATSHDAVVAVVRGPLHEAGLAHTFAVTGHRHEVITGEKIDKKGQPYQTMTHYHEVDVELRLIDSETGYAEVYPGFGAALDSGDKGYGKAVSCGKKYALLTVFMLETGEDVDVGDQHTSAELPPTKREASADRAKASVDVSGWPEPGAGVPVAVCERIAKLKRVGIVTEPQRKKLWAVARKNDWTGESLKDVLATIDPDVDSSTKIPGGEFFSAALEAFSRYRPNADGSPFREAAKEDRP